MKTLTQEELRTLFSFTVGSDLHAFWVVLETTGLRLGEALGLRWQDIDFIEGRLQVRRAIQHQKKAGIVFVEPKTSRSRRTVYFPKGTVDALKEHRLRQLEARLEAGSAWQDNDLLFCKPDGSPLDPDAQPAKLHKVLREAGLPQIRIHDLRHTAASLQLANGENPKVVQEMLGHSTIAITMDIYSHVTPTMHAATARKMQVLFADG